MNNKTIQEILDFDLIRELDLQDLPKEKQNTILAQFSDILLTQIMEKVTTVASLKQLENIKKAFTELEQKNSPAEVTDFLRVLNQEVENFEEILGEKIFQIKKDLSELFAEN